MKISNEVKVGLLAVAAILLLIFGFNFLKGTQVFSKPFVLYARFPEIGSLEPSNEVKINGLTIGTVHDFRPADKEVNSIIVEIHLSKEVTIPKTSVAFIDGSIIGSAYINIEKGPGKAYLNSGDNISTRPEMSVLSDLRAQIAPTITRLNETFDSLKITIGGLNSLFDASTKNNLRNLITNLTISTSEMAQLLDVQSGALSQTLSNMNNITGNLARNNDAITSSIRNIEVTTSRLANANIEGMVSALQTTVSELKNTITGFNSSLNSKDGTLGLLLNDRQMYNKLLDVSTRLDKTALSAEILLDDIRLHPKRYLNISIIGGGKGAEPITSPASKDTIPR